MNYRPAYICALLLVGGCARGAIPIDAPVNQRVRPDWTSHLPIHVDAMRACLAVREAPRYVVFLDPLPSGATAVTSLDAYGAVEDCAYLDGEVVRREPTQLTGAEVVEAGAVLFSLGPVMPVVPAGIVLEEVIDAGIVVGWLYWPKVERDPSDETDEDAGASS